MIKIRRLIIYMAQILALLFIVIATLVGALLGQEWLLSGMPILASTMVVQTSAGGISIFGALAGFFISTMLAAVFFVVVEIAHNTRNPFNT